MKALILLAAISVWPLGAALAQPAAVSSPGTAVPSSTAFPSRSRVQGTEALTSFDLNFPGGEPRELVAAIQKAMGRPLNVIIPDEYADIKLPALKMSNVNVQQLFSALQQASHKSQAVESGNYYGGTSGGGYRSVQVVTTSYGFQSGPGSNLSDDTIWYFYAEKPVLPPVAAQTENKICKFYSLTPYLERHFTVDDITTAIETGWKMLGESSPPKISFHKDTKLLIAVGEPNKLEIIDAALKALQAPARVRAPAAPAEPAKSAEDSKSGGGE